MTDVEVLGQAKQHDLDPFSEVWTEPLSARGQTVPRQAVFTTDPEGEPLFVADVSPDYRLIANETARQIMEDVVNRAELGTPRPVQAVYDGRRFLQRYVVDEVGFSLDGDEIQMGIQLQNSYDGTSRFGVTFFAFSALHCLNQFHLGNRVAGFLFRHTDSDASETDLADAVDRLGESAHRFAEVRPLAESMREQKIDLDRAAAWFRQLSEFKPTWHRSKTQDAIERLVEHEERTLWGLLNATTWVTTHDVGGFSADRISENAVETAAQVVEGNLSLS